MRTALTLLVILAATSSVTHAQWMLQTSNSTADLRGIHSIGGGVAWASGTNGTVLRTEDGGYVWQSCSIPPGAEKLDFRGIQAFDANTAIVMSSGKGDLSRIYRTTDGCHSWKLVFTNPDKDGFWDAIQFNGSKAGMLLGDPAGARFAVFVTRDGGEDWTRPKPIGLEADGAKEAIFAASNSSLIAFTDLQYGFFVTGGAAGAHFFQCRDESNTQSPEQMRCIPTEKPIPLGKGTESSGAFSVATSGETYVAVGGDYAHPDESAQTAAYSQNEIWHPAQTLPHGYRSAVAFEPTIKTWITVGPNGTDISTDDGKNWHALRPDTTLHEAADADRNWNALSLPFVVGPHGRIGKLDEGALKH